MFGNTVEFIILPFNEEFKDKEWGWNPEDINFTLSQHKLNFLSIEKEFGSKDTSKWKYEVFC